MAAAADALPFSDDILAEIFIRLPTLEDLGRACASCPAFNRVITSHSFLRRLHALHPPSLLGFLSFPSLFHPVESPHPSGPAARAVAEAANFEFSFLPKKDGSWMVRDARGGRFVLDCDDGTGVTFTTIAVCDPLFRRHVLLPPLPQDLAAAVEQPLQVNRVRRCDVFLAPCGEGETEEQFNVIWMALCPTKLVTFMFSSASCQWRALASCSWRDLNPAMPPVINIKFILSPLLCRSYAYGCFYWSLSGFIFRSKLIVLDVARMKFYPVTHPSNHRLGEFAVVELGESRLGMFMLGENTCDEYRVVRLFSASNQIYDEGAIEWVLENTVSLYCSCSFSMLGAVDEKLLLQGAREHNSEVGDFKTSQVCISLDFKTSQVQRVRGIIHSGFCPMVVNIGYPPSLSLPTI